MSASCQKLTFRCRSLARGGAFSLFVLVVAGLRKLGEASANDTKATQLGISKRRSTKRSISSLQLPVSSPS